MKSGNWVIELIKVRSMLFFLPKWPSFPLYFFPVCPYPTFHPLVPPPPSDLLLSGLPKTSALYLPPVLHTRLSSTEMESENKISFPPDYFPRKTCISLPLCSPVAILPRTLSFPHMPSSLSKVVFLVMMCGYFWPVTTELLNPTWCPLPHVLS